MANTRWPAERRPYAASIVLHNIYGPAGRRILLQAGLKPGMHVADFGCGVGAVTRMLGEIVGPSGSVTGIDASAEQIEQAAEICQNSGLTNVAFRTADACATRLPPRPSTWCTAASCFFICPIRRPACGRCAAS